MFGRKKKYSKYKTFYRYSGEVGEEYEHDGKIWKILAVTGERLITDGQSGGSIDKILYCEYQCTVVERLQKDVNDLQVIIRHLNESMKEILNNVRSEDT